MAAPTRGRRRAKVSVTVDPTLLEAVDLYVQAMPIWTAAR